VKASTGGGIVFGCISAGYACSEDYESRWRKEIGFDLRMHLMIHRFLSRLSDKNKDRFFTALKETTSSLERAGDMDYATKTLSALLKTPRFMLKTASSLPWLLADLI
jgi:flavin-dependent dehydrogenase